MYRKAIALFAMAAAIATAQQPQTQTAPIYSANAKYVQGVGPGYWPTAGSGLTLNLSAGTANCAGTIVTYAGSTLTMTASQTNYVYLNTASSCVPASNTTGFSGTNIPIAVVVAGSSTITSITDDRTMMTEPPAGSGGISQLTGDVTAGPGVGSQAASVVKVNGAAVPASKTFLSSNSGSQIVDSGLSKGGTGAVVPTSTGTYTSGDFPAYTGTAGEQQDSTYSPSSFAPASGVVTTVICNGSTDLSAIQTALNKTGVVNLIASGGGAPSCGWTGGVTGLIIPSNTILEGNNGTITWTAPSGTILSSTSLIANTQIAQNVNRTIATFSTTANSKTVTCSGCTFVSADLGNSIALPGALSGPGTLNTRIVSLNNSTSILVDDPAQVTQSATGSNATILYRDQNITVRDVTLNMYNAPNCPAGGTQSGPFASSWLSVNGLLLQNVVEEDTGTGGCKLEHQADTAHSLHNNVTYWTQPWTFPAGFLLDGIDFLGPNVDVTMTKLYGWTDDNFIGIGESGGAGWPTQGVNRGFLIEDVDATSAYGLIRPTGSGAYLSLQDLTMRHIHGNVSSYPLILAQGTGDNWRFEDIGGSARQNAILKIDQAIVGNVWIDGVYNNYAAFNNSGSTACLVNITASTVQNLNANGLKANNYSCPLYYHSDSTTTITNANFDNWQFSGMAGDGTNPVVPFYDEDSTYGTLNMTNWQLHFCNTTGASSNPGAIQAQGGSINYWNLQNINADVCAGTSYYPGSLFKWTVASAAITLNRVVFDNINYDMTNIGSLTGDYLVAPMNSNEYPTYMSWGRIYTNEVTGCFTSAAQLATIKDVTGPINYGTAGSTPYCPSWPTSTNPLNSIGPSPSLSGCSYSGQTGTGYVTGAFTSGTTGTCSMIVFLPKTNLNYYGCFGMDISTGVMLPQTAKYNNACQFAGPTTSGNTVIWNVFGTY